MRAKFVNEMGSAVVSSLSPILPIATDEDGNMGRIEELKRREEEKKKKKKKQIIIKKVSK